MLGHVNLCEQYPAVPLGLPFACLPPPAMCYL